MNAATARELLLAQRTHYIGGTDAAAIVGISPFATPLTVYLDKVQPEAKEDRETMAMRRGLVLERFIADEFCRSHPGLVTYHPKPVVRTDWGFPAGASLDFYVAREDRPRTPIAMLETKTAMSFYSRRQWQEPAPGELLSEGDLPDSYYAQVQWYLAVTGLPLAYAAADTGDESLTVVPIEPNERVQTKLIESCREFWLTHVEAHVAPEPSGTGKDAEALQRMWPDTIPDPPVTLEDELADVMVSDYLAHELKAKEHKAAAEKAKQQLQALMGENERAQVGSWLLTWKTVTSPRIDSKRLKAERPDVASEYTTESTSRRFAVKETS